MATKASCTLFLIIEKKHAPWGTWLKIRVGMLRSEVGHGKRFL